MYNEKSMGSIVKARQFAKQLHKDHKRLSGESYFDHVERVYTKLKNYKIMEETTLIAAYLHHTLDFSDEAAIEIEKVFGKEIVEVVKNFKKLAKTKIGKDSPKEFNERYIIQTYINLSNDLRTLVIRLADKIDNLENSWVLPKEKREYVAERALYLYAPLAKIIGMSAMSTELETQAFKILEPDKYAAINTLLEKRLPYINKFFSEVEPFLKSVFQEHKIDKFTIQTRTKGIYSTYRKAAYYESKGRNPGKNFENIYDVAAMRVIVDTVENCYVVENILNTLWTSLQTERDDYIKNPRANGYQSIHNIYEVEKGFYIEVQIRTFDMHEENEYGIASHLIYKLSDKGGASLATTKFQTYLQEKPGWFKELNFWEAEKALAKYKPKLPFSKNIYTFTPKGDIIELPEAATPVDFAYAVHSKLGNSCVGAFVNGAIASLSSKLENGDLVEIKTLSSRKKPSSDWLKFVKTKKARDAIRKALEGNGA